MSADRFSSESRLISEAIGDVLDHGSAAVLATLMSRSENVPAETPIGAKLLVKESGERVGSLGDAELDVAVSSQAPTFRASRDEARMLRVEEFAPELDRYSGVSVLFERIEAEPRLVIAGAGHVGASLARLAAMVGYRVSLIDDRAEFVTRELFSSATDRSIDLIPAADWSEAVREAIGNGRGVSVAIVTRGHKQDEECLRAAAA